MVVAKPIVKYQPSEHDYIEVGHRAYITPLDPSRPTGVKDVLTSKVIRHLNVDGVHCFETENTIYSPLHDC